MDNSLSSGREIVVVMTDGKPTTVIKQKNEDGFFASAKKLPFKFTSSNNKTTDQIETKRLKSENALLLNKIKNLEEELDSLTQQISDERLEHQGDLEKLNMELNQQEQDKTNDNKSLGTGLTCSKCGSAFYCGVDLIRLVDRANKNTADNRIVLKIESPLLPSPLSPTTTASSMATTPEDAPYLAAISQSVSSLCAQQQVDETFQKLQEELVACKLREAESSLGFKELQQKVNQLGKQWQQFLKDSEHAKSSSDIKTRTLLDLREAVMAMKVRETCMVSDFNELKQKLIEMETENNVYKRQEKRLQEEVVKLEEKLSLAGLREDELVNDNKELERKMSNLETKYQEDLIMFKIKDAENCQSLAGMRRKIAELEIENQELVTALKLNNARNSELFEKFRPNTATPVPDGGVNESTSGYDTSQPLTPTPSADIASDISVSSSAPTFDTAAVKRSSSLSPQPIDHQPNVLELLSRCDMSDIMTESFFADAMFLQTGHFFSGNDPTAMSTKVNNDNASSCYSNHNNNNNANKCSGSSSSSSSSRFNNNNNASVANGCVNRKKLTNLQSVDCDSLEKLNDD